MGKKYTLIQFLFIVLLPGVGFLVSIIMSLINIAGVYKNKNLAFLWWFASCGAILVLWFILNVTGFIKVMLYAMSLSIILGLLLFHVISLLFGLISLWLEKLFIKKFIISKTE